MAKYAHISVKWPLFSGGPLYLASNMLTYLFVTVIFFAKPNISTKVEKNRLFELYHGFLMDTL